MYYSYVEIEYVATSFSPARRDLALKLLIEIIFFLIRIDKLNKTLVNHPWQTPSKEAPGGGVG